MTLLGIDIGTTHCKAALFAEDGTLLRLSRQSPTLQHDPTGFSYYDPQAYWSTVIQVIRDALENCDYRDLAAIGIASMAETGLPLDRESGSPVAPLLPWFDPAATPQAERLARADDPAYRFCRAGIHSSFKCSLAKMLWLQENGLKITSQHTWLSTADWVTYRLTGRMATDYSLAGRTYAFRVDKKTWDLDWLDEFGFSEENFPAIRPSGAITGRVTQQASQETGLPAGVPVAIAGHDHICAAFAAGIIHPGQAFDSMGTAEALLGPLQERLLTEADFASGLSYGCHVVPGRLYWLGGLSTSGGSVEWMRGMLGEPAMSHEVLEQVIRELNEEPGDVLYFPYLAGSGSPHTDLHVRGALMGLSLSTNQASLVKAVLEGTAYEVELIHRSGEAATGTRLGTITAAGGGTRYPRWMQIKADVSGCRYEVLEMPEATLAGAALLAGIGQGVYSSPTEALGAWRHPVEGIFDPDQERHIVYQTKLDREFLALQDALRAFYYHHIAANKDIHDNQPSF